MEPYEDEDFKANETSDRQEQHNRWAIVGLIALLGVAGIVSSYAVHERGEVQRLTEQASTSKNEMNQLQTQVNTLTARLNDMTAAQATSASRPNTPSNGEENTEMTPPPDVSAAVAPSTPSANIAPTAKPVAPKHSSAKRKPATDKRYDQLKTQLDNQQKELKQTEDELAKNRTDLEGSINSTRDELNGSIAKTHDELVALEKRGERSYFEFDLTKSKEFQRVGPLSLSLRKADTKHKNYDLAMLVDDNELSKKKVNLYEPVWIHTESGGQPVQIVVNRIDKNGVHGYVSAPKYKQSELATLSTQPPASSGTPTQPSQQSPQ